MSDNNQALDGLLKGVGIYSIVLAVVGSIGNITTAGVCLRESLRNIPTLLFTAFIAIFDIVPLLTYNLNPFSSALLNVLLFDVNVLSCKLFSFLNYWGRYTSAFILVANAFDRYMSVRLVLWRKVYFNSKRALLVSAFLIVFSFLLNINILINDDYYPIIVNKTAIFRCSAVGTISTVLTWNQYINIYIPFALLATFNILLLYTLAQRKITKSTSSQVLSRKQRALTISIVVSTLTFIITKAPGAVFTGFYAYLIPTKYGSFLIRLYAAIGYTHSASNLFVQLVFNSVFLKEFKSLFFKQRSETSASHGMKLTTFGNKDQLDINNSNI